MQLEYCLKKCSGNHVHVAIRFSEMVSKITHQFYRPKDITI